MSKKDLNAALRAEELRELERERALMRRMEKKGLTRKEAEVEREQRETQKPYIIAGLGHERMVERAQEERKGLAVGEYLKRKEYEDPKNFERNRERLAKQGAELWEKAQRGKRKYYELEEQSHREIMDWKTLKNPLKRWLESEGEIRGWKKEMIENSIEARRLDFETAQHQVRERLKAASFNPEVDFRERLLDPSKREEALRHYLVDRADKARFLMLALNILFSELDKLKR